MGGQDEVQILIADQSGVEARMVGFLRDNPEVKIPSEYPFMMLVAALR